MNKAMLRTKMRALRFRIASHERRGWEASIAKHVLAFVKRYHRQGEGIAAYWHTKNECSTQRILKWLTLHNHRTLLPFCTDLRGRMLFKRWSPYSSMEKDAMGMMAPRNAITHVPSFCIVPMLGWDAYGRRLGQGGGYYDRMLARLRKQKPSVTILGVAFWRQKIGALPTRIHDQNMDAIATEQGITHYPSRKQWSDNRQNQQENTGYGRTFQV